MHAYHFRSVSGHFVNFATVLIILRLAASAKTAMPIGMGAA